MTSLETFCRQIRARSTEHRESIQVLHGRRLVSQVIAILRQELDSMVRVIFLLSIADQTYRQHLIDASVNGTKWTVKGKSASITDREMVELSQSLQGWTQSVYKFGCAFIHLSSFHDYEHRDPFRALPKDEKAAILKHMRAYHGGPADVDPTFDDLVPYLPAVFEKVAANLEFYLFAEVGSRRSASEERDLRNRRRRSLRRRGLLGSACLPPAVHDICR